MKKPDQYKEVQELRYGNAIICIYRPELTEEERKKRETRLAIALQQFGKEMYEVEQRREAKAI